MLILRMCVEVTIWKYVEIKCSFQTAPILLILLVLEL
jgi:hypothetical protein